MTARIYPFPVRPIARGQDYYQYDRSERDSVEFDEACAATIVREFRDQTERERFLIEFAQRSRP